MIADRSPWLLLLVEKINQNDSQVNQNGELPSPRAVYLSFLTLSGKRKIYSRAMTNWTTSRLSVSNPIPQVIRTSAFDDINLDDKLVWKYAHGAQKKNDHAAGTNDQSSGDDDSDDGDDETDNSQEATDDSDSMNTTIGLRLTFIALALVVASFFVWSIRM